jgi:hypothetical protein
VVYDPLDANLRGLCHGRMVGFTMTAWQHWALLSPEQLNYASDIGRGRNQIARKLGRKHTNNLERDDERDLRRDIIAAQSELAGRVFLGSWASWNDRLYGRIIESHADLEDFIDVKAITSKTLRLIVPRRELRASFAYVLVYCNAPWFWIKGWKWGREMTRCLDLQQNRPCFVTENHELHDPIALQKVALKFRGLS